MKLVISAADHKKIARNLGAEILIHLNWWKTRIKNISEFNTYERWNSTRRDT